MFYYKAAGFHYDHGVISPEKPVFSQTGACSGHVFRLGSVVQVLLKLQARHKDQIVAVARIYRSVFGGGRRRRHSMFREHGGTNRLYRCKWVTWK